MKVIILLTALVTVYGWTTMAPEENIWGNMSLEEWSQTYLMQIDETLDTSPPVFRGDVSELDAMLGDNDVYDIRDTDMGYCIGDVRDQGACGACWAFAVAEVAEDKWCWETGEPGLVFSTQHLMDCDTEEFGCMGAITQNVIKWVGRNELVEEACYPYLARQQDGCYKDGCREYHVKDDRIIEGFTADILTVAKETYATGPVYVSMQVMSDFFSYKEGIFFSKTNRNQGGHAVELVGFGKIPEDDEAYDASDETK